MFISIDFFFFFANNVQLIMAFKFHNVEIGLEVLLSQNKSNKRKKE